MENFPITRLAGVVQPAHQKQMVDYTQLKSLTSAEARVLLGDGNFGGDYQKSDEEMDALWQVAVSETRGMLQGPWRNGANRAGPI
jgi:creatinine amidohydrolase